MPKRIVKRVRAMSADNLGKHFVVVHRWGDEYAKYDDYIDHGENRVSYISTVVGRRSVPSGAVAVVEVDRTDDVGVLRTAVTALAERFGPPDALVAFKEGDHLAATALRQELDLPGHRPEDLACFLDKFLMLQAQEAAGVRIPAYAAADSAADVLAFGAEHGWPVVVKPRRGSASQGVRVVGGPEEAAALTVGLPSVVEAFLAHQTYHVDGVFDGARLAVWRASRYVNSCLAFTTGAPLGSVELDDAPLLAHIAAFTERALAALSTDVYAFHLELFIDDPGDGSEPCITFLEVGRRVGGAEIPFLWREVHGIDLLAVEWALESGAPPVLPSPQDQGRVGGWLLMPLPAGMSRPCRITRVTTGDAAVPPYAQRVPAVGDVIPAADAYYEHVGGRFRFVGRTTAEVEAAIRATAEGFDLRAEAVTQPVGTP